MGDRLYMLNAAGEGASMQEQVLCLDANTGRTLWNYRFNVYGSDVPPHRAAWASPVADPDTGRVYAMGVGGRFLCLDSNGKLVWDRSLAEEFGLITTHGGRTVTPIVHGDLVITSGIMSSWGAHARSGHRYLAMDKATGEVVWFSKPGANPYDTCYPTPIVMDVAGKRLLVDGGADGAIYAMKLLTGELVWHFPFSKRAINASVVTDGKLIFASHGQENYDTNVMGRVVALKPDLSGKLDKSAEAWRTVIVEFPSAALHNGRLYMADNGANLICLDSSSGKELWRKSLGTIQRASPVYADGKIYIGTENGKFYILRPSDTGCEVLDVEELRSPWLPDGSISCRPKTPTALEPRLHRLRAMATARLAGNRLLRRAQQPPSR
jgi:outer membrane protein assembly factor BamB